MSLKGQLKKVAGGFTAMVLFLFLVNALAINASAQDDKVHRVFFLVAISQAPSADGITHRIAFEGAGAFDTKKHEVEGGGSYIHWDNNTAGTNVTIIDSGTWVPTEFLSFTLTGSGGPNGNGTAGPITSGILEMHVNLISDVDQSVTSATFRLICNIGFANVSTGEVEGFRLTINGASFGTFVPLTPTVGITHIGILPRDIVRGNKKAR